MTKVVDQKTYLMKYLSGPSGEKKKKKKRAVKGKGFKIIDDDIDLSKLRPLDGDELDIFDEGEDAPQIAGIVDERPEELKKLEQFKVNSKWRVINQDDGFNSDLKIEEIKKDIKEQEKENEVIFGKMYSDSEDEKKNDSDLSPPRKTPQSNNLSEKNQVRNDGDFNPDKKDIRDLPPKQPASRDHKDTDDSDHSPPRKAKSSKNIVRKPSRWSDNNDVLESAQRRKSTDSDLSPCRKRNASRENKISSDEEQMKRKKHKNTHTHNSVDGLQRKNMHKKADSPTAEYLSTKKKKYDYNDSKKANNHYKYNEKQNRHHGSSDSDLSPQRKNKKVKRDKSRNHSPHRSHTKRKHNSDSDLSPPRKEKRSVSEKDTRSNNKYDDSPPPSNKKMAKTLEGKKAGLQNAAELRDENESFRNRENEAFSRMTDDISGRNAKVVSRKGKRETSEERKKQIEKAERQKELDEKYKKWSKGLKQVEAQEARIQEFMHEASKPLARYKDDRDLGNRLKEVEREGDPMLKYMREKKRERGELGPEKPMYKGNFPPNRFNIRPGYRWDGVDRSNGYEKKFFDQQSKRRAQEEEAYKWSIEDL